MTRLSQTFQRLALCAALFSGTLGAGSALAQDTAKPILHMNVQQAAEAHNITSYQMQSSFGAHQSEPGRLAVTHQVSPYNRATLEEMGYQVEVVERTYSPITAIWFDQERQTMQGAASDYGDDYGIAW